MHAVAISLDPISPLAPAGRDARLEPEHELIRSEVEKITGLAGAAPDWALVESAGLELLRAKSKDLLIGAYVAYAMIERHGIDGANTGLGLLAELMARFGAELHPARARARVNALQWFLDRIGVWFEGSIVASFAQVRALQERVTALRVASTDLLGDEAPSLSALLRHVERLEIGARAAAPESAAPAAPEAAARVESAAAVEQQAVASEAASPPSADAFAEALLERWMTPIGASGVGEDASYDDPYILVRQELEKLQSLAGGAPDWLLVHDLTSEILQTKSKDLVVAVQLTAALLETQGLTGLAEGLALLSALVERYWPTMWPPLNRVKKRVGALQWLIEFCAARLSAWPASATAGQQELGAAIDALAARCARNLGAQAPDFAPLRAAVSKLASSAPAAAREVAPPSAPVQAAQPDDAPITAVRTIAVAPAEARPAEARPVDVRPVEARPAPPRVDAPAGVAEPRGTAQDASYVFGPVPEQTAQLHAYVLRTGALLVELGRARFEADKSDARAYRWLRTGLFLRWEAPPPANRRGRIENDGPSSAKRAELFKAVKEEAWEAVLMQSEALLARNPFWLDLQRISALALQKLGDGFALAQAQVEREARALVARLPQLLELQFADGTALGSPETLTWLKNAPDATRVQGESAPIVPPSMLAAVLRGEAAQLAEFEALLRGCSSRREAFQLRLELAGMLHEANRLEQAKQLYLGLEQELDRYSLDQWEPELACRVLRPLWKILSAEQAKGTAHPEGGRICARLARLSPTSLL